MPTEQSTADYEIGAQTVQAVVERITRDKRTSRILRLRMHNEELLPKEVEGMTPIAVHADLLGEYLELWYIISCLLYTSTNPRYLST